MFVDLGQDRLVLCNWLCIQMRRMLLHQNSLFFSVLYNQENRAILQNAPKVTCLNCKDLVPLTLWEEHDKSCNGGSFKQTENEFEVCSEWNLR